MITHFLRKRVLECEGLMEIIEILSKCKIAIEGNVISNETLMKYFSGYLSTASGKDEYNTVFVQPAGMI